ncbi:hypothetical protein A3Q56_04083 [Intoshia linei]|uniref:Uncharacterized protein n=1 Tax=Intoshia linei TaxID=1819745 RepID=A0A177B208_9BILA|nr:hypothetical protein A3Q56_04083 [Intoshia linei]
MTQSSNKKINKDMIEMKKFINITNKELADVLKTQGEVPIHEEKIVKTITVPLRNESTKKSNVTVTVNNGAPKNIFLKKYQIRKQNNTISNDLNKIVTLMNNMRFNTTKKPFLMIEFEISEPKTGVNLQKQYYNLVKKNRFLRQYFNKQRNVNSHYTFKRWSRLINEQRYARYAKATIFFFIIVIIMVVLVSICRPKKKKNSNVVNHGIEKFYEINDKKSGSMYLVH